MGTPTGTVDRLSRARSSRAARPALHQTLGRHGRGRDQDRSRRRATNRGASRRSKTTFRIRKRVFIFFISTPTSAASLSTSKNPTAARSCSNSPQSRRRHRNRPAARTNGRVGARLTQDLQRGQSRYWFTRRSRPSARPAHGETTKPTTWPASRWAILLYLAGEPGEPPLQPPGEIAYGMASTYGAFGIAIALYHRLESGNGQYIDVSMHECAGHIAGYFIPNYGYTGAKPARASRKGEETDFTIPTRRKMVTRASLSFPSNSGAAWSIGWDGPPSISGPEFEKMSYRRQAPGDRRRSHRGVLRALHQGRTCTRKARSAASPSRRSTPPANSSTWNRPKRARLSSTWNIP